jgi:ribosomal protein S18 acetylase RimI-like enzyme
MLAKHLSVRDVSAVLRETSHADRRGGDRCAARDRTVPHRDVRRLAAHRPGFQDFQEEVAQFPGEYSSPSGAVLLAYEGKEPSGVVTVRRHGRSGCEMKRLYVLPKFRGRGVGRALSKAVIQKAVALGYAKMRLDTLPSMEAAIALYRALGFREIPAYRYNPVAGAKFMELVLSPS